MIVSYTLQHTTGYRYATDNVRYFEGFFFFFRTTSVRVNSSAILDDEPKRTVSIWFSKTVELIIMTSPLLRRIVRSVDRVLGPGWAKRQETRRNEIAFLISRELNCHGLGINCGNHLMCTNVPKDAETRKNVFLSFRH